jgi:UDP-N-acetylglucosamine:LPS N-acetylglucosamine transferase
MKKEILLVYGSGGHNEQMKRIFNYFQSHNQFTDFQFISLCDKDVKYKLTDTFYEVGSVTEKFSFLKLFVKLPRRLFCILKVLVLIKRKQNIKAIISTGPGIAIVSAVYFKIFTNVKIIHIETWSRFNTKSLTGRFLYLIADYFFVQNQELLKIYPNAKFKGRL